MAVSTHIEDSSNDKNNVNKISLEITPPTVDILTLAKEADVDKETVRKVKFILKHGSDDLIKSVREVQPQYHMHTNP